MILLREFTQNDTERLVAILNDDLVTQFLSTKIPFPYTKEDALWWVNEGSKSDLIKAISLTVFWLGVLALIAANSSTKGLKI